MGSYGPGADTGSYDRPTAPPITTRIDKSMAANVEDAATQPVVEVAQGRLLGSRIGRLYAFRGVPYAFAASPGWAVQTTGPSWNTGYSSGWGFFTTLPPEPRSSLGCPVLNLVPIPRTSGR
jgi:hypothetical protein